MLRIVLAVAHLLALGIGLGAIYARARHLATLAASNAPGDALNRVFRADNWWAMAAILWVGSGLWRALAGTEKASTYYWAHPIFWTKMGLLGLVLLLELWPMITLIRWRVAEARDTLPAVARLSRDARIMGRISQLQTALSIAMVVAATMLARGYGAR